MLFLGCHFQYPCFYMVTELVEGPLGKNNLRKVIDDLDIRPGFNLSLRQENGSFRPFLMQK